MLFGLFDLKSNRMYYFCTVLYLGKEFSKVLNVEPESTFIYAPINGLVDY